MIHKPVFDDDDDKPLVPLATVHVCLVDGVLTYSAVAHDWLSIHDPDVIGVALHDGQTLYTCSPTRSALRSSGRTAKALIY